VGFDAAADVGNESAIQTKREAKRDIAGPNARPEPALTSPRRKKPTCRRGCPNAYLAHLPTRTCVRTPTSRIYRRVPRVDEVPERVSSASTSALTRVSTRAPERVPRARRARRPRASTNSHLARRQTPTSRVEPPPPVEEPAPQSRAERPPRAEPPTSRVDEPTSQAERPPRERPPRAERQLRATTNPPPRRRTPTSGRTPTRAELQPRDANLVRRRTRTSSRRTLPSHADERLPRTPTSASLADERRRALPSPTNDLERRRLPPRPTSARARAWNEILLQGVTLPPRRAHKPSIFIRFLHDLT